LGSRGPRGPGTLTYPVRPVRQVSQYFGRRIFRQSLTVAERITTNRRLPTKISPSCPPSCPSSKTRQRAAKTEHPSPMLVERRVLIGISIPSLPFARLSAALQLLRLGKGKSDNRIRLQADALVRELGARIRARLGIVAIPQDSSFPSSPSRGSTLAEIRWMKNSLSACRLHDSTIPRLATLAAYPR